MQNHTTIIGVHDLRAMGCTYDDCRAKYGIGNSAVRRIWKGKIVLPMTKMWRAIVRLLL